MMLMRVDFPAPFGPRRPRISPSRMSRERLSIARIDPNVLTMFERVITGVRGRRYFFCSDARTFARFEQRDLNTSSDDISPSRLIAKSPRSDLIS